MAYTATLQKLSENLSTAYNNTIFKHGGNMGDTREKAVIDYLCRVMPHRYGFKSGEVFDEADTTSGQVDVIVFDNLFSPVFTDGTDKVLAPVESTYGVISVKSQMGTKELDDAIEGVKKYDSLLRPQPQNGVVHLLPDFAFFSSDTIQCEGTEQKNINCIFAFDTTVAQSTIIERMKEADCLDLLVVPGKFCAVGRMRKEMTLSLANKRMSYYVVDSEKAVSLFVIMLQVYLSGNHLIGRDLTNLATRIIQTGKVLG
jgi:hypothetical protein